jgi:hypothetical protein
LGYALFTASNNHTTIKLNQFYLLNKLGYQHYFISPLVDLDISFCKILKTISHELAHYCQFVKYGVSSCESDLDTANYD